MPLDAEIALLRSAGFRVELLWRRGAFAVIRAARSFQTKIAGWRRRSGIGTTRKGTAIVRPGRGCRCSICSSSSASGSFDRCLAIAVGVLVAFTQIDRIVAFVFAPMRKALPPGTRLIYTAPGEAFSLYINIALIAGCALASPYVLFQVWRLIAPALYTNQKKFAIPFVLMSSSGIVAGWLFSHYIVFPYMIEFFGTFSNANLQFMPKVETAFDLYTKMLLGMAIVFQMPTAVFFLAKMGLVSARFLWSNIKYAILIIFILAAVLTPSGDPWNQTVFAAPMIVLYLLSIGIAWVVAPACRRPHGSQIGLQQATKLPFRRVVGGAARLAGRVDPDRFLLLALHLDDRRLPA